MSFLKNKYVVIKKIIPEDIINFCYEYSMIKRKAVDIMFNENYISPFSNDFGTFKDTQVPNTYSHYADFAMETLLLLILPRMEKETKLKLVPNYSYMRIYKNGDVLKKHTDRFSCEVSTTLNLGGDPWDIYIQPDKKNSKPKKIGLEKGDMLIYKGNELKHWRDSFDGDHCVQVFLHYTNKKTKGSVENKFDGRPFLGLPSFFKKELK